MINTLERRRISRFQSFPICLTEGFEWDLFNFQATEVELNLLILRLVDLEYMDIIEDTEFRDIISYHMFQQKYLFDMSTHSYQFCIVLVYFCCDGYLCSSNESYTFLNEIRYDGVEEDQVTQEEEYDMLQEFEALEFL